MSNEITSYGFNWGTMVVERVFHELGRGRVIEIRSGDNRSNTVQVYVSEKGRSIRVYIRGNVKVKVNGQNISS